MFTIESGAWGKQEDEMQLKYVPAPTAQSQVPWPAALALPGTLIEVQNLSTPSLQDLVNQNQYFTLVICLQIKTWEAGF